MRNLILACIMFGSMIVMSGCTADGMQQLSIKKALRDTRANANLDRRMKMSFGKRGGGGREYTAIRRTNGVNKTTEEACNRAFLSALIALQDRARKQGKRSVVGIYSYHKKRVYSSGLRFQCDDGKMMSAVTLRGKVR